MKKAELRYDREYAVGRVDPRLKGTFVEHLGRCLYQGLYEPDHPSADLLGFRNDVKKLIRELGITCIRYPGGNFVSGYHWMDGIGERSRRPVRKNLAWNTLETNEVGLDEFAALCRELGTELIMACNMGTGTIQEAADLVDYCNTPAGTEMAEMRRRNGHDNPYGIRTWCVGNEMDGEWQIGALCAQDYAKKAREAAKMIRWTDPLASTVFCGTCTDEIGHPTYGEWDRIVLEEAYDQIDFLSIHRYYNYHPDKQLFYPSQEDPSDAPYFFRDMSDYIHTVTSVCDFVKNKKRKNRQINISFDEWGLVTRTGALPGGVDQQYQAAEFTQWDAVLYGGLLCTLLNHADRVCIACQSLLVNEGGMITTVPGGPAYRQSTYWPFRDMAHLAGGISLMRTGEVPVCGTGHHGEQETLISAATYEEERKRVCVFLANVDTENACDLTLRLTAFEELHPVERRELYTEDRDTRNTVEHQDLVVSRDAELPEVRGDAVHLVLKPHSWNVLTFHTQAKV